MRDAWVNSWFAIELYFKGSDNNKLAITQLLPIGHMEEYVRADWL